MTKKEAINLIENYISRMRMPDWYGFKHDYFTQQSYAFWAVGELLEYVKNTEGSFMDNIMEFIHRMDRYSVMGDNSIMFSIAKDLSEDILDELIGRMYSNEKA